MPEFEQRSLTFAQRVDGRWWMSQVALSPEHSVRSPDAEKGRELLARRTKDTIESLAVAELYQRRWGWDYEVRCSEIVVSPPRDAVWQPVTLRFDWIAWKPGVLQLRSVVEQPQGTKKETVIDTLHQEAQQFDWQADETGAIGLALVLNGRLAYPMFEPERGLHVFRYPNQTHKCLVDIGDHKLSAYAPPAGIDRRGAIGGQPLRRTYDVAHETMDDERLGKRLQSPGRGLDHLIAFVVEVWLRKDAESLLEG